MIDLGVIQVTSAVKSTDRLRLLQQRIIPTLIKITRGKYTLVSPAQPELQETVEALGGHFLEYTAWEVDKSRKFREAIPHRQEEWVAFLDDDILPDEEWLNDTMSFLESSPPGQYGFRLTDEKGNRHEFGEDWMQFPSPKHNLHHRGLKYDVEAGTLETSPTSYVANSIVHRDVYNYIHPFGLFQKAPDVNWCFAIKQAGFPVGFNLQARAYHLGDRSDNR
jgi:chloramphenicol 3-O-phosphotransferase